MICHHCKEELYDWEGIRGVLLPNSIKHVFYHTGCYQQLREKETQLKLNREEVKIS